MSASFIIRFHTARLDNLNQMLRLTSLWHSETIKNCELITVCQNELEEDLPTQQWGVHKNFNLKMAEMNMAYVTNFGVKQSSHEKVFVLDSDRILPSGYFSQVIEQLEAGTQITTLAMKKMSKEYTDEELINESYEFDWDIRSKEFELGRKNVWSGNVAFMKEDYIKAGMMDESYIGYGWDDVDMSLNMDKTGIGVVYREEIELHLWHPYLTYGTGDQRKLCVDNGIRLCQKWNKPFPHILRRDLAYYREEIL